MKFLLLIPLFLIPIVSSQIPIQFSPYSFNESLYINETKTVYQNITNIGTFDYNITYESLDYPEWFEFTPEEFNLTINETKNISIKIIPHNENISTNLHVCYLENTCYLIGFNITVFNETIENITENVTTIECPDIDLITFPEGIECTGETFYDPETETCYATNCTFEDETTKILLKKPFPFNPTVKNITINETIYQVNFTDLEAQYSELYGRMDDVTREMIETRKHGDAQYTGLKKDFETMNEKLSGLENATYQKDVEDVKDGVFEFLRKSSSLWHTSDELMQTLNKPSELVDEALNELMVEGLIDSKQRVVRIKEETPEGILIRDKEITEYASLDRVKEQNEKSTSDFFQAFSFLLGGIGLFAFSWRFGLIGW